MSEQHIARFPQVPTSEVLERFAFHPPANDYIKESHENVREMCGELAAYLNENLPESREKALALTKVQEAMWAANTAVALNQEFGGLQE